AVVVLDPLSGEVLTMLGSPDYFEAKIDGAVNATTATRQPGSSIKPITYAAAFDPNLATTYGYRPLTPASVMVDVRTAFVTAEGQPYVPKNYDQIWRGPVLLRPSLASSYNLIAVKVLDYIGLDTLIDLSRTMGITTFDNKKFGLALTLGGGEVRLLEMTAAYGSFANGGRKLEPVTITRITDHAGTVLYQTAPDLNPGPQVFDPRTAYLITDILSDNYARRSTFGAGNPLQLTRPAAAKTGTTQDWRDNWTIGYTPDLVTGVWAGNADNEPMRNVSGVTGAAPIWRDIMEELHKALPVRHFAVPQGIEIREVCADNGLLPVSDSRAVVQQQMIEQPSGGSGSPRLKTTARPGPCPHLITEKFIAGTAPESRDDAHLIVALDRRNGLKAGPGCPLEFIRFQSFTRYPSEAEAWARQQGVAQIPNQFSPPCPGGPLTGEATQSPHGEMSLPGLALTAGLIFTSPDQGSVFRLMPNIPADKQQIRINLRPADGVEAEQVVLLVNGQPLVEGWQTLWPMQPGIFTFEARGLDRAGRPITAQAVTIEVVE
ncbi:MAG: penicillin-binding transpeptidase domain-containing protein, partial [Anaerolineae bacterium]|nr:penicillin-binding transpeptidase domain-containing protein [Anaerolineae bacterium]